MSNLRKIDKDFSYEELLEYESRFNESFDEIFDDTKPQAEKVAFLGFLCSRRDCPELTFDDYLDTIRTPLDAQKDAFKVDDELSEYLNELSLERAKRMARWCQATGHPPSEFKKLTVIEQNAFVIVLEERNEEQLKEARKQRRRR